ncbi:MAG: hypothetical protein EZS28_054079, partial [Streblomastix strix]
PEEKIPDEEKEKIEKAQDLHSLGAVMFELAELGKLPDELSKLNSGSKSTSPDSYKFKRLPNGEAKQLILYLLTQKRPNTEELLSQPEIQERIKQWKTIPTNSISSLLSIKPQYSIYRIYLAQLLIEIAGASTEVKLAVAQRDEFIELTNILIWSRQQSKDYARPLQEWVCEVVDSLIDKNKEAVEIGFETDIVLELQTL